MKAPKLLLDHISAVSRLGGTKAGRSAARGISVALAAVVIPLYSMFLLQALTPEPELWRWIEFYEGGKYETAPLPMKPESLSVGKNLGALICRRDYMCAMESVSLPTRAVHHSPGVYRFCTNVVVYALTHGGISDYSGYVHGGG